MNRVIADYLKRWWWVFGLTGIAHAAVCWFVPLSDGPIKHFFPYVMFAGPFLLSMDLHRGHARVLTALPLTTGQIAKSLWMAAVGVPAVASVVIGLVVGGVSWVFHRGVPFHFGSLVMICVANIFWLGATFFLLTGLPTRTADGWIARLRGIFFGSLWGLSVGGAVIFPNFLFRTNAAAMVTYAVLAGMSLAGWLFAESFVLERAGIRRSPAGAARRPARYQVSHGLGGIPLLIRTTMTRTVSIGLTMVGVMMAVVFMEGRITSLDRAFDSVIPAFQTFPFWVVVMFQTIPIVMQLRLLRTLPLSPMQLSLLLVILPVMSILVLGLGCALLGLLFAGAAMGLKVFEMFLLSSIGLALIAPAMVWWGCNRQTLVVSFFFIFAGSVAMQFPTGALKLNEVMIGIFWLVSVAGSWALTHRGLRRSHRAYRVEASLAAWGNSGRI